MTYGGMSGLGDSPEEEQKRVMPPHAVDKVFAEFGIPLKPAVGINTKRSMRSCRERGNEKGRSILAKVGQ